MIIYEVEPEERTFALEVNADELRLIVRALLKDDAKADGSDDEDADDENASLYKTVTDFIDECDGIDTFGFDI